MLSAAQVSKHLEGVYQRQGIKYNTEALKNLPPVEKDEQGRVIIDISRTANADEIKEKHKEIISELHMQLLTGETDYSRLRYDENTMTIISEQLPIPAIMTKEWDGIADIDGRIRNKHTMYSFKAMKTMSSAYDNIEANDSIFDDFMCDEACRKAIGSSLLSNREAIPKDRDCSPQLNKGIPGFAVMSIDDCTMNSMKACTLALLSGVNKELRSRVHKGGITGTSADQFYQTLCGLVGITFEKCSDAFSDTVGAAANPLNVGHPPSDNNPEAKRKTAFVKKRLVWKSTETVQHATAMYNNGLRQAVLQDGFAPYSVALHGVYKTEQEANEVQIGISQSTNAALIYKVGERYDVFPTGGLLTGTKQNALPTRVLHHAHKVVIKLAMMYTNLACVLEGAVPDLMLSGAIYQEHVTAVWKILNTYATIIRNVDTMDVSEELIRRELLAHLSEKNKKFIEVSLFIIKMYTRRNTASAQDLIILYARLGFDLDDGQWLDAVDSGDQQLIDERRQKLASTMFTLLERLCCSGAESTYTSVAKSFGYQEDISFTSSFLQNFRMVGIINDVTQWGILDMVERGHMILSRSDLLCLATIKNKLINAFERDITDRDSNAANAIRERLLEGSNANKQDEMVVGLYVKNHIVARDMHRPLYNMSSDFVKSFDPYTALMNVHKTAKETPEEVIITGLAGTVLQSMMSTIYSHKGAPLDIVTATIAQVVHGLSGSTMDLLIPRGGKQTRSLLDVLYCTALIMSNHPRPSDVTEEVCQHLSTTYSATRMMTSLYRMTDVKWTSDADEIVKGMEVFSKAIDTIRQKFEEKCQK